MRRLASTLSSAIVTLALVLEPSAAGASVYVDRGRDADDAEDVDIRSSTRAVWRDDDGKRWLTIRVRTYDRFGPGDWQIFVMLDARRGPRRDQSMTLIRFEGDQWCFWRDRRDGFLFDVRVRDHVALCAVPMRRVDATKRVRWRIRSPHRENVGGNVDVDRAPDRGWYV